MNFFVKPFLFIDPAIKERFWEIELEIYVRLASQQNFPFSFQEFLNLPVYMREKAKEIHRDIIESRAKALERIKK